MAVLTFDRVGDFVSLNLPNTDYVRTASENYRLASPFPHCVIEDFIPRDILNQVAEEFPDRSGKNYFDRDQERFKWT
jgi:hypothetical protein